jgi:hypothetical protein
MYVYIYIYLEVSSGQEMLKQLQGILAARANRLVAEESPAGGVAAGTATFRRLVARWPSESLKG